MSRKSGALWFWLAGFAGVIAIGGVIIRYTSVFSTEIFENREAWGQFGDYFGGILNPILSFAAFVTLLINLRVQLTASAMTEKQIKEQVREQRLFQLLDMVMQSAVNTKYQSVFEPSRLGVNYEGHTAMHHAWNDLSKHRLSGIKTGDVIPLDQYEQVKKEFWFFKRVAWGSLNIFVQSSFLLIDFILKNGTYEDGFIEFSMSVLKAQMSDSERMLLWYSALCLPKYSHALIAFEAFDFIPADAESIDPLVSHMSNLAKCALVTAHMIKDGK
jgi:uncharacterized membrane protein